ncbi:MAG: PadR family transcriptional regulator [Nitrososphaerota archaeon]|jgi:DNA-binding PadR family transcriptional regulator|nr:PadR family transcriptional regulator [Nitrososphaerota archaeon]
MSDKNTENSNRIINSFTHFYILTQLYGGPIHGYQIINHYKRHIKKPLSPNAVYPFLQELEEQGYLTHTTTQIKEKNRKTYHLTPSGQAYCNNIFATFNEIFTPACKTGLHTCPPCTCPIYKNIHNNKPPNNT